MKLKNIKIFTMLATLMSNIDVIPMTRYEYKKKINETTYVSDKKDCGFYFPNIHVWLSEDNFYKYFKLINED